MTDGHMPVTTLLQIQRGTSAEGVREENYTVEYEPGQSVLDGLRWIRRHLDSTLAIRFSCINANACKECVMRIDGKTAYACTTPLQTGVMKVAPLPNKRLIRDLVTDTLPPDERLESLPETS